MANPKGSKILVVDDEKEICSLLKEYLEDEGYIVEVAYNGKEGTKKACSFQPDIILLDIRMPKMGGIEAIKEIRKCCSAPIIVVTALTDPQTAEECLKSGAFSYITKPIDLDEVKGEIEKACG